MFFDEQSNSIYGPYPGPGIYKTKRGPIAVTPGIIAPPPPAPETEDPKLTNDPYRRRRGVSATAPVRPPKVINIGEAQGKKEEENKAAETGGNSDDGTDQEEFSLFGISQEILILAGIGAVIGLAVMYGGDDKK